jgi:hypothetical protein
VAQVHGWLFRIAFVCMACLSAASVASAATPLDVILNEENSSKKIITAPTIDDLSFLRRLSVDMIGRIPTLDEIKEYEAWPAAERRGMLVDKLLKADGFADRWTVFMADLLRIRTNADGGAAEMAFVHKSVKEGMPYDVLCQQLITAVGKAGKIPEVGFVLNDNADPMALAGTAAQVFMGVRIACAQCHDHPFDVWTREQFYGMAAYFGKTQRREIDFTKSVYAVEMDGTRVKWPPEGLAPEAERKAMIPAFPFDLKLDAPAPQQEVRLVALRKAQAEEIARREAGKSASLDELLTAASTKVNSSNFGKTEQFDVAGEAKKAARDLKVDKDLYNQSELRSELARYITHPRNRYFSRAFVNRVWADLMGRGIVEPIDDFSDNNPPSHDKTLNYLADEFVAGGYDLRNIVKIIVMSDAYQRGHLYEVELQQRKASEEAFAANPVRRMLAETMFDSVVAAGHLFAQKHAAGDNLKTIKEIVQVPVDLEGKPAAGSILAQVQGQGTGAAMGSAMGGAMAAATGGGGSYDLESAIEVDFNAVLAMAKKDEPKVEQMMVSEEDQSARMLAEEQGRRKKYIDQVVERQIDDNPVFASAMRMASPAPPAHFLRVFGQPARDQLGDHRDHSPSMRQALMMLNGKMTHEASRVGKLEPIYPLLVGKKADLDAAVKLAYREILTREPSSDELADAKSVIAEAATPVDGMADLRWVLFNSHEFRFVP